MPRKATKKPRKMTKKCPQCAFAGCYHKAPICEKCRYKFRPVDTVADSVETRCARNEVAVVVAALGKPSRVYGLEQYLKMCDLPRQVKPWEHRKSRAKKSRTVPDPLGAVEGTVLGPLSRDFIYEED